MANHIQQLLNTWYQQRDDLDWVIATIIGTEGSSYRKPGAMMMINSLGQYHGLLSGGCLESDIMRQSRQCWISGKNNIIQYDMREEEDIAWQLGIGCGGLVRILLQPVSADNKYLELVALREQINLNKWCMYQQTLSKSVPLNTLLRLNKNQELIQQVSDNNPSPNKGVDEEPSEQSIPLHGLFEHIIKPSLRLAIFGGGIDAIPLANIAANVGWHVLVADPRTGYARQTQFPEAQQIIKASLDDFAQHPWLVNIDAVVIMTHNVKLDAQALVLSQSSSASYVGMLGPLHRTERVLSQAELPNLSSLSKPLSNPIGLRLGGELPESIALSIVSEIHAFMESADARSISEFL
jgi:xanthine/CO dehydrogenase XdhC/CoxF family maturation factor